MSRSLLVALALGAGALSAQSPVPNAGPGGSTGALAPPPLPQAAAAAENAAGLPLPRTSRAPGVPVGGSIVDILVYDENTVNGLAATAAQNLSFFGTTIAGAANFNSLLTSGSWDAVAVDCPSTIPTGGWNPLISYVNGGGRVVLSFWDWDATPSLLPAFDVSVSSSISLVGATLEDSLTTPAFLGVTMPNSSWNDAWVDDGDQFNPQAGALGLAHIGTPATPVLVSGNGGRTIAGPVFDEAGPVWLGDVSGVQLWMNMVQMVGSDGPDVLVYDHNTQNNLAQIAAFETSPGGTRLAQAATFNGLLAAGPWDAVLVDVPSSIPTGGWTDLINYANGGGHVVVSYWDWDAQASLSSAFDVSVVSSFSWTSPLLTLFDSGVSDVFAGVTMPNSSWNDFWGDYGDRITPQGAADGLGHVGNPAQPVLVYGNSGRTLAAPVFDEAGPVWLGDGSAVQLWKNMLSLVSEPDASCTQRNGILGLNPSDYACTTPPVVGGTWVASVSTTPLLGTATLTTFVTVGLGGPIVGFPIFGFELLILPPFVETTGFGVHNIPLPPDPLLVGVDVPSQGARIELGAGGALHIVLTNAQDLVLGF